MNLYNRKEGYVNTLHVCIARQQLPIKLEGASVRRSHRQGGAQSPRARPLCACRDLNSLPAGPKAGTAVATLSTRLVILLVIKVEESGVTLISIYYILNSNKQKNIAYFNRYDVVTVRVRNVGVSRMMAELSFQYLICGFIEAHLLLDTVDCHIHMLHIAWRRLYTCSWFSEKKVL